MDDALDENAKNDRKEKKRKKENKKNKKKVTMDPWVKFEDRSGWSCMDYTLYVLVIIFFFAQIVIATYLLAGQNIKFQLRNNGKCPGNYDPINFYGAYSTTKICLSKGLHEEKIMCQRNLFPDEVSKEFIVVSIDDVAQKDAPKDTKPSLWDVLGQHIYIPLTILGITLVFIFISALLLWKVPLINMWASIIFFSLSLILLGISSLFYEMPDKKPDGRSLNCMENDDETNLLCTKGNVLILPIIWGILIVVIAYAFKKQIARAAKTMSLASEALLHRPHVVGAALIHWGIVTLYVFFITAAVISPVWRWKINPMICHPEPKMDGFYLANILMVMFVFIQPLLKNAMMPILAAGVGEWYFPDPNQKYPGFTGLLWAGVHSIPANAASCLVINAVDSLRFAADGWANRVLLCPLYIVYLLLQKCVNVFSRYMLIAWTFHGGNVFGATKRTWRVLRRHLGELVSNQIISNWLLIFMANMFAKIMAICCWVWLDSVLADKAGDTVPLTMGKTIANQIFVFLAIISYFITLRFPLVTIFFVSVFGFWMTTNTGQAYFGGMFIGSIACLILNAAVQIMISSTDTIFYCYALEQYVDQRTEGREEMYKLILECKKEYEDYAVPVWEVTVEVQDSTFVTSVHNSTFVTGDLDVPRTDVP